MSTSRKQEPKHPVPAGHLPARVAQPGEPAGPCQQPRVPLGPRGSPPPCLVPARLQLWAVVPWPHFAAFPQQGRRTQANATHMWLPQQSYGCVSGLPLSCYLRLILANGPRKKAAHLWSCGSMGFNIYTSLHGPPLPCITRAPHYTTFSAHVDKEKAGKAQGPAWQGCTQRSQATAGCLWHQELLWQRDRTNGVHAQ